MDGRFYGVANLLPEAGGAVPLPAPDPPASPSPPPPMPTETPAPALGELEAAFEALDTDGSGTIDIGEFRSGFASLRQKLTEAPLLPESPAPVSDGDGGDDANVLSTKAEAFGALKAEWVGRQLGAPSPVSETAAESPGARAKPRHLLTVRRGRAVLSLIVVSLSCGELTGVAGCRRSGVAGKQPAGESDRQPSPRQRAECLEDVRAQGHQRGHHGPAAAGDSR